MVRPGPVVAHTARDSRQHDHNQRSRRSDLSFPQVSARTSRRLLRDGASRWLTLERTLSRDQVV